MRVLYLCSDFGIDPRGTKGASIHLRAITRALAQRGHDVLLLSPKDGPESPHPARRLLPGGCPPADECNRLLKPWMVARELGDSLAKELRPLLYNAWALDRALEALRADPVDVILERLSLHGHLGLDIAAALDIPHVVEVNALLTEEARQFRGLQLPDIAATIENRLLTGADAIVTVSDALAEQVAARGVAREAIRVTPNGADIEHFDSAPPRDACRAALGYAADHFVIGFLGTLKPWHGADALVDAFARFAGQNPAARLLMVGSGPEEQRLRDQIERHHLSDRCKFIGPVEHDRVPALLRAMDVAAAPYRPMDGFYFSPIKLFEYMAAGVCVVASRIGQIETIIVHESNGWLCRPGDVGDLAAALERMHTDRGLRHRLAEQGRQCAISKHSWMETARLVETALFEAIAARRRRSSTCDVPPSMAPLAEASS